MHEQRTATARVQEQVISELGNKGHKLGRVYKYKYTPHIAMTVDTDTPGRSPLITGCDQR
jgi:hypothetical protein